MVDLPTLTKTEFLYLNLGFSSKNHNYLKKACTQITKPIEHRYEIQVGKYTPSTSPQKFWEIYFPKIFCDCHPNSNLNKRENKESLLTLSTITTLIGRRYNDPSWE